MNTVNYKFYRSKAETIKLLMPIVMASLFLVIPLMPILVSETSMAVDKVVMPVLAVLYLLLFLILSKQVVVEITPGYIKIGTFEKLYWTDIDRIECVKENINGREFIVCNLWPKNMEKYHVELTPKVNINRNGSPFFITNNGWTLSSQDWNKLMMILKERMPNNNIQI